jgi:hypothetical protein
MKRVIQQCSFLHHAPFATKEQDRSSNVCSSPLLLPDGKERDRSFISQVTGPSSLNCRQEETDRERGVRDRLHQKDVHARKGGIQSSGDKRMHARRWMDGCGGGAASSRQRAGGSINREACIIVQAAKLAVKLHWVQADERKQHKQHGTPKGSTKLQGLGEPQRARERTPCHALDAVPCRNSSTLCRQAGGARQLLPDRWREWRAGPDHEQSTAHYP